ELLFPTPHFESFQDVPSHVFSGTVYHVAQITPPADLEPGTEVTLKGTVSLLVCDEVSCEPPSDRQINLTLPVVAEKPAPSSEADGIDAMLEDSPFRLPRWQASAALIGDNVVIEAEIPAGVGVPQTGLYFFPNQLGQVAEGKEVQQFAIENDRLKITIPKKGDTFSGEIAGRLVADSGFSGLEAESVIIATSDAGGATGAPPEAQAEATAAIGEAGAEVTTKALSIEDLSEKDEKEIREAIKEMASWIEAEKRPVLLMILFAFLGGIILNLMPCVFPVLGVKIMGFVNQAGEDKAKIRRHGLVFAAGVIVSLWALVAALLILKHTGEKVGWGFQLQNPTFLALMILVLFAFALNLSGLFEFGTSLTSAGSGLQQKHGYSGSFFSGILAVLVATPCTGPFMGPAIGFAITGSDLQTIAIFTALGLGLALPYVILSYFPYLIQKLPKPGPWMETFKQFMAFPLFATVIWLVGVFGKITGLGAISYLLFGLMLLAFGLWIFGRFGSPFKPKRTRMIGRVATVAALCVAGWFTIQAISLKHEEKDFGAGSEKFGIAWQEFDPRKIVQERKKGRTVFIDFTADW
ncbi:MAG: protein-disulfide reductase DsbD family protein, partial [Verrucomicrobiales bacterium]